MQEKKKKVLKINLLTLSIKKRDFMKRVETHLEISLPHCYPFFSLSLLHLHHIPIFQSHIIKLVITICIIQLFPHHMKS